jgi:hypothetical protein
VLCAWSIFVLAGIALQKTSEHWEGVVDPSARARAGIAFGTVQALAGIASLLVVAGAVAVLPAVARFLAAGGWRAVRRSVLRAAATCAVSAVAFGTLLWWAHRLSEPQRNGADLAYGLSALGAGLLVVASIATVTAAGVQIVRQLRLSPGVLRLEGRLAEAVTAAMAIMAVATCVWWGVVAAAAPWFFGGTVGRHGSGIGLRTVVVMGLMLGAVVLAALGSRRVREGMRRSA